MEKSAGTTESAGGSGGRERLGMRFTIDYLLFNKGRDGPGGQPEARAHAADARPPRGVNGEPGPGSPKEGFSLGLGSRGSLEKGAEGSEERNEGNEEGGQGSVGSDDPQDKPNQSYIALISMAILASGEKKLLLCDIYQWIMDHYPYFKSKDKNWRNSVRHNLSLNECFVKAGRSDNGKGHFWAVHPANLPDFSRGDYHRRRRTRRRIRRAAGQIQCPVPPPVYHPVPRSRDTPLWGLPPDRPLSCVPAGVYWSWATLPAPHIPPYLSLI
ncbi:forkhead box Q2 [Anguilla anguilla]|uniref:forkhead box Q2 n=1 Tax=Anguilla anguilla TaxID=7936 RepID=UPI0015B1A370|nr:forkhead box Q2 [Anguilla anguilla]